MPYRIFIEMEKAEGGLGEPGGRRPGYTEKATENDRNAGNEQPSCHVVRGRQPWGDAISHTSGVGQRRIGYS